MSTIAFQGWGLPDPVVQYLTKKTTSGSGRFRMFALEGDASDRSYFRLAIEESGKSDPDTFVIMKLADPWEPKGDRLELPFVNIARHLREKGIPVPEVFVDASEQGYVLLEDVGTLTLEDVLNRETAAQKKRRYECAIDLLVRMQREASKPSRGPCYALTYAFDAETFFRELCFFREHAIEGLWGHRLSTGDREELEARFRELCEEISQYPQVFTHRDYHSRNIMVQGELLRVLDFQDARRGPITYDLVSLLKDSYVSLTSEEQETLIVAYRELARGAGLPCPVEGEFQRAFVRTGLQRNLKAIGTFAYQAVLKGVGRYLPYIPNTVNSVKLALEKDGDLAHFRQILQPYLERL